MAKIGPKSPKEDLDNLNKEIEKFLAEQKNTITLEQYLSINTKDKSNIKKSNV